MSRLRRWQKYFEDSKTAVRASQPFTVSGRLTRVAGLVMEAVGLKLPVGNSCYVIAPTGQRVDAEVVGFSGENVFLMPATDVYGLEPGAVVVPVESHVVRSPKLGVDFIPRRRAEVVEYKLHSEGVEFPNPRGPVLGRCDDLLAAQREGGREDVAFVFRQLRKEFARSRVPDPHFVLRRGGHPRAIRRERCRLHESPEGGRKFREDAARFYKSGKTFVYRHLPFWLASLVNRVLVVIVPLAVLLIPAMKLAPWLYRWRISQRIYRRYGELMALERVAFGQTTPEERADLLRRLDEIEKRVITLRLPGSFADQVYLLRQHIGFVRGRLAQVGA